ncbi:hypothetical protein Avbf_04772 [Armadillidium vulgare]|nr:hypothetical protein Avbf_04772 [Armadillidium vulgare]
MIFGTIYSCVPNKYKNKMVEYFEADLSYPNQELFNILILIFEDLLHSSLELRFWSDILTYKRILGVSVGLCYLRRSLAFTSLQ